MNFDEFTPFQREILMELEKNEPSAFGGYDIEKWRGFRRFVSAIPKIIERGWVKDYDNEQQLRKHISPAVATRAIHCLKRQLSTLDPFKIAEAIKSGKLRANTSRYSTGYGVTTHDEVVKFCKKMGAL